MVVAVVVAKQEGMKSMTMTAGTGTVTVVIMTIETMVAAAAVVPRGVKREGAADTNGMTVMTIRTRVEDVEEEAEGGGEEEGRIRRSTITAVQLDEKRAAEGVGEGEKMGTRIMMTNVASRITREVGEDEGGGIMMMTVTMGVGVEGEVVGVRRT